MFEFEIQCKCSYREATIQMRRRCVAVPATGVAADHSVKDPNMEEEDTGVAFIYFSDVRCNEANPRN